MSDNPSIDAIFCAAIEIESSSERQAWLEQECGDNVDLRRQVDRLLDAHFRGGSIIDSPAHAFADTLTQSRPEHPGTQIGPYKLLQQIGEGGMGVVYMAEQTEPVKRKVALKLIKPGMDSRQIIARFEAERQALAMMDHVNIARVLDAGTVAENPKFEAQNSKQIRNAKSKAPNEPGAANLDVEDSNLESNSAFEFRASDFPSPVGRPYFVMELIHGIPITKYCDDNHLTPRQRLELFVPVCHAIQHAHQKGIIHRDIKPSNVMVTLYDGKPVPKVIDFGVSKATEQKLTERTLFTQYGTMIGTLEYMSPEQAEMSALGIDTRSDIYSLGVLLYELLTGSTPLSGKRMKEAAYAEILRLIKEEEPPKPSTRLSDSGEALASISAQRHTEPAQLSKLMRGELDWIVMKTLEKDRNRRYETANGFAADVQRYLDDEQVQACPPSAVYRLRKFARRNKTALATASVVSAALVLGILVSTWQAIRATHAETLAQTRLEQTEEARTEAVANLRKARDAVDQMLTRVAEEQLANVPQMEPVRKALLEDALKFYEGFLHQNSKDPALRLETGQAFTRVGAIYRHLGRYEQSEKAYQQSIAILETLAAELPSESAYRNALAKSHKSYAFLLHTSAARNTEAEKAYRQALRVWRKLAAELPLDAGYRREMADCLMRLGNLVRLLGHPREAEVALLEALPIHQKLAVDSPKDPWCRHNLAINYHFVGALLKATGREQESVKAFRQGLEIEKAVVAESPDNPEFRHHLAETHLNLGWAHQVSAQLQEAENSYGQAVDIWKNLVTEFPHVAAYRKLLMISQMELGKLLKANGRSKEAEKVCEEALKTSAKFAADFPGVPDYWKQLRQDVSKLVSATSDASKVAPSVLKSPHEQALAVLNGLNADDAPVARYAAARLQIQAGDAYRTARESQKAEHSYRTAITLIEALPPELSTVADCRNSLIHAYSQLGDLSAANGPPEEAEKPYHKALEVAEKLASDFPGVPDHRSRLAHRHRVLAQHYARSGRALEAEQADRRAMDLLAALTAEFPQAEAHWYNLALVHGQRRQWHQAIAAHTEAIELKPDYWEAWHNRGVARTQLGQWDKAITDHTKVIELKPDLGDAWHMRGWAHANLGQWDKAAADQTKALELIPKNWWCWQRRAQAYTALKQWDQAVPDYAKAIELGATEPDVWLSKAAAHARLEQPDQAIVELRQAIAKGFQDATHLKNHIDLTGLREREDFQKLVADLEAKNK